MIKHYIIFIALLVTISFGFKSFTNPVFTTGRIKQKPKDSSVYIERLVVFVRGDGEVLAKTITDNSGSFKLNFIPNQQKSFDFFCTGVGLDTLFIASYINFDSATPGLTFFATAIYKKNFWGNAICPKCKKADKTMKIIYGMTGAKLSKKYFEAGSCTAMPAKYFCIRDKIKF